MVSVTLWWVITIYVWLLLARIILSWVPMMAPGWEPKGFVLILLEGVYTLTDPPIKAISKFLPPVRLGNVSLDLSVLALLLVLQILQSFLYRLPF